MKLRDGRNLGYSEYGKVDGIPLLLFHGTPGSRIFSGSWIKKCGMRVITPERPGYGLSDPAPERRIGDWAADIGDLADYLGLFRFHVAGGSGGGPYALACAIHLPARVLSATLFCTGCPPEFIHLSKEMHSGNRVVFFLAKYAPFLLKPLLAISAHGIKKHPAKYLSNIQSRMPEWDKRIIENKNSEQTMMHLKEAYRQGVDGTYRDLLLVSRPWCLDLDKIAAPVFMWHGTADTLMPISSAREFSKLIPGCEPHFISGAGHQLLGSEEICSQMMARILSVGA